jgi:hypothetical protein
LVVVGWPVLEGVNFEIRAEAKLDHVVEAEVAGTLEIQAVVANVSAVRSSTVDVFAVIAHVAAEQAGKVAVGDEAERMAGIEAVGKVEAE